MVKEFKLLAKALKPLPIPKVKDGVTYDARDVFIDSPDVDQDLKHGDPPAGKVFPLLR